MSNWIFFFVSHCIKQVLQFYDWKRTEWHPFENNVNDNDVVQMSELQWERVQSLKLLFVKNYECVDSIFTHRSSGRCLFEKPIDWASFAAANVAWEAYTRKLHQEILVSFPEWKAHHSIFSIPSNESWLLLYYNSHFQWHLHWCFQNNHFFFLFSKLKPVKIVS